MEQIQIELEVSGDIVNQIKEARDFVSYLNDWLKPQGGEVLGPIQTRSVGSQTLENWQLVLTTIAPPLIGGFFSLLIDYRKKIDRKIKIKKGTNSLEVPSDRVSDEEVKKLLDPFTE